MNELGNNSYKIHYKLLKQLDDTIFKFVILCGEFFELSIKNFLIQIMNLSILKIQIKSCNF